MNRGRIVLVATLVMSLGITETGQAGQATESQAKVFTVPQAVEFALTNYPAVRASLEQYNTARAGVGLARTNYVPFVSALDQTARGTRNSVLGVLLPQFPTILTGTQGTVTPAASQAYTVSGMGVLFTWEPFTLGYRHSIVQSAQASANLASAQVDLTRLGVASSAANASLAVLADEQRVKASVADVTRREVFDRSVHALVDAHLRPGADASRADAELAVARTHLIETQETEEVDKVAFAELLGIAGVPVEIQPGRFLEAPPEEILTQMPLSQHPAAVVEQRRIEEIQSRLDVIDRSYFPHLYLEELTSGRGSDELSAAKNAPGATLSGFLPSVFNWQAGVTVQMNLSDWFGRRERQKIEQANERREEALYDQTKQTIIGQVQRSLAALNGARRVAENTPVELAAARQSEAQARARFQAGVGTIVDVAQAQGLLVQAEIDDSLARLSIWRALAALAAGEGDLTPFLNLAGAKP
ncbi:MAG TPA: TolC family protein [Terriglobia bacterium]|nr:TolC family protein [Terriglobia bacterium]